MKTRLEIGLDSLPLDAIEAEVVVAGFFLEDRPLRGGAGRVDWRLCGRVSQMLLDRRISAELGSASLMAATPAFKAPRILLFGLGSRADFALTVAQDLMRDALERCLALGLHRIALAPLGIGSNDFVRHAVALAGGAAEAMGGEEATTQGHGELDVCLSVPEAGIEIASEALQHAVAAFGDNRLMSRPVTRRQHRPAPRAAGAPRGLQPIRP
jgi:hypothetical protein